MLTKNHGILQIIGATVANKTSQFDNSQAISLYQLNRITAMRITMTPKVVQRLLSADGYLDLGMPRRAVAELEKIQEPGVLEGPVQLMHGIALKQTNNPRDAIPHLERAARVMPSPIRRFAWRELVDAYRAVGNHELAEMAEKLGGDGEFQLRIALPYSQMMLNIPTSPKA